MGHFHDEIPEYLIDWMLKQQMFWVASAPLSSDGLVNISPKGIEGTFHVVNTRRVWYEDLSGTGAETVAHLRENGRITILFHAFEGPARIVRLYGKGFFYEIGSPEYEALLPPDKRIPGSRAIIGLDVSKVGTTCGYAVPYYQFIGHRSQLVDWAAKKESFDNDVPMVSTPSTFSPIPIEASSSASSTPWTQLINPKGMVHWWQSHNLRSLDGLPSFSVDLGRGFPFNFSIQSPTTLNSSRPSHKHRARSSSTVYIAASTPSKLNQQNPMSLGALKDVKGSRHQYIASLLPLLLMLLLGIFLGRAYEGFMAHDQRLISSPINLYGRLRA